MPAKMISYSSRARDHLLKGVNTLADAEPRNNFIERALTWNANGVLDGARYLELGGYYAYVIADAGLVILNLDNPLKPKVVNVIELNRGHSAALQFRYLWVTDADGLKVVDVSLPEQARLIPEATLPLSHARRLHLARTYAYVANGPAGLAIVDITKPLEPKLHTLFRGNLSDANDVAVASTNASLFAYVADGAGGLKIIQLTSPSTQPNFYGFSPEPKPELIASYPTASPALALNDPLERDRGVDETGGQVAVFGRVGSRPFNLEEMRKLFLKEDGTPWFVENSPPASP